MVVGLVRFFAQSLQGQNQCVPGLGSFSEVQGFKYLLQADFVSLWSLFPTGCWKGVDLIVCIQLSYFSAMENLPCTQHFVFLVLDFFCYNHLSKAAGFKLWLVWAHAAKLFILRLID